ncbi:MAG: carboxypeptidase M32 [Chloroflexi bacterium]|nr:carboxypeptidase M32 [Chloroflexota bacterium]
MHAKLDKLKTILTEVDDLDRASSVLGWDQEAYMPPGGAEARGQQLGTLQRLSHERFTSKEVGNLLDELQKSIGDFDPDSDEARLIKVAARLYARETKVPSEMVTEKAEMTSLASQAWQKARAASDFSMFEPHLEKVLDWSRRYAELYASYDHIYDPLMGAYEPGMKTAEVKAIFEGLRPKQVKLIAAISEQQQVDDAMLHQHFPEEEQFAFSRQVLTAYGYDWDRGREDKTTHPFSTNLGYGDQRITVRVSEDYFNSYLFAALHEAGHALYEQGVPKELARSPLYGGASLAIHESQSRMWENLVGRSLPFWTHFFSKLQELFPEQLAKVNVEDFYRAINRVSPSYIRVEADEATYNLHIMLRLELEIAMLEGSVEVKDMPSAWNERFESYLGVTPLNDAQGVLQDVHWSFGLMGYFSTYALGNLVSAQLWEVIHQALPDLESQISRGEFAPLHDWLRTNIYKHGAKFEPQEMVQKITGSKINGDAYIRYLNDKFGAIYDL